MHHIKKTNPNKVAKNVQNPLGMPNRHVGSRSERVAYRKLNEEVSVHILQVREQNVSGHQHCAADAVQ